MNKAVFLDKDGTLIVDVPYNVNPDLVTFQEGVIEGLIQLQQNGFELIVITNQPGVALGLFSLEDLKKLITYFFEVFKENGITLGGFYFCPHAPGGYDQLQKNCKCRKPSPGLILEAARDLNIDLSSSWMVGDILNDVEAGRQAGCKTVLINNGNETEWILNRSRTPDYMAANFRHASDFILSEVNLKL